MQKLSTASRKIQNLAHGHLHLLKPLSGKLNRWYRWVATEDLESYVYLGLVKAAGMYDETLGIPFEFYACRKAMYLAIDEMRKDGVLKRKSESVSPTVGSIDDTEIADPSGNDDQSQVESKDFYDVLMGQLADNDRRLLELRYSEQKTFGQIAEVFSISESAVCVRHKKLIEQMRELADHALAA